MENSYYPPTSDSDNRRRVHRVYNPYETLQHQQAVPLHQLIYDLPTSPEFLFTEEASIRHRSWGHNISYCSGLGYLSGSLLGGAKGTFDGLRAAEIGDSLKLRANRVLNSGGHTGRRFGNTFGILGLIFSGLESGIMGLTGSDGYLSTVAAGLGTGAIYKAARGPRSAVVAGAIGGLMAGAAVAGKQVVKRYIPI